MDNTNIFIKKTELNNDKETIKYSKSEIMKSIPDNSLKNTNEELSKTKIEWRWRFFKIPNKNDIIEISFKKPNENRKFINKNGDWIDFNIDDIFDQFVIDSFYHYE
jgi:hypothetical protein